MDRIGCRIMKKTAMQKPLRFSLRERKQKRTYSDYVSDDSAVETDLDSGSELEFVSTSPKRFKSGSLSLNGRQKRGFLNVDLTSLPTDGEKLLMRHWLQKQADQRTIPGLCWFNKDRTQIRIPWKHGSRTGWTINDCMVYQAWAVHTGKIATIHEPKKWKANFRCALNSLPDVRELGQLSQKKGNDPFKVYEMLPEVPRKSLCKRTKEQKTEKEDEELTYTSIKIKEEVNAERLDIISQKTSYLLQNRTTFVKTEASDNEMPYPQALIPTVVEEFSEPIDNEFLSNFSSTRHHLNSSYQSPSSPSTPSSSPSLFSPPLFCESGFDDCTDITDITAIFANLEYLPNYKSESSYLSDFALSDITSDEKTDLLKFLDAANC